MDKPTPSAAPAEPSEWKTDLLTAALCVASVGDPTVTLKPENAERIIGLLELLAGQDPYAGHYATADEVTFTLAEMNEVESAAFLRGRANGERIAAQGLRAPKGEPTFHLRSFGDVSEGELLKLTERRVVPSPTMADASARPMTAEGEQYRRMFIAACEALGSISEALGLDPDDGGAEPILEAIAELKDATHPNADAIAAGEPQRKLTPFEASLPMAVPGTGGQLTRCPRCKGSGTEGDHNGERYVEVACDQCKGTGEVAPPAIAAGEPTPLMKQALSALETAQSEMRDLYHEHPAVKEVEAAIEALRASSAGTPHGAREPMTDRQIRDLMIASLCVACAGDPSCTVHPYDAERVLTLLETLAGPRGRELMQGQAREPSEDAKEAARYRYLRDRADPDAGQPYCVISKTNDWGKNYEQWTTGKALDNAIDGIGQSAKEKQDE